MVPTVGQIEYVHQGLLEFFGQLYQPDNTQPFGPRFFEGVARDLAIRACTEPVPNYVLKVLANKQRKGE